jgi:hypothetical protein
MINPFTDGIFHGFSMINYHLHFFGDPPVLRNAPLISPGMIPTGPIPKNGATPGAIPATTLGSSRRDVS